MTTPPEPSADEEYEIARAGRGGAVLVSLRDTLTVLLLLAGVALIIVSIDRLAGGWWAMLAGGIAALAAGLVNDLHSPQDETGE